MFDPRVARRGALALLAAGCWWAAAACGPGAIGEGGDAWDLEPDPDEGLLDELEDDGEVLLESHDALVAALLDNEELAFLTAINNYRAANGLAKLRVSIALTRASDFHSRDLAATNLFQHESSDGTGTFDRIRRFYNHQTAMAENIALGYNTGAAVFEGWRNSPGHNANMKNAGFTVIGISRVPDDRGTYWTTDFGGYRDAVLSAGFGTIGANGSFESDAITTNVAFGSVRTLNRWHTHASGGGSSARRSGGAAAGSWSLRNVDKDPGTTSATQLVRAAAGVNYQVSAKFRRVAGSSSQLMYLDFLDASYTRISAVTVGSGTATTWTAVSKSATSPARTAFVRVILYGSGAAGRASTVDWDDVRVTAW